MILPDFLFPGPSSLAAVSFTCRNIIVPGRPFCPSRHMFYSGIHSRSSSTLPARSHPHSHPGDPTSDTYLSSVDPFSNAVLTPVGRVNAILADSNSHRLFSVSLLTRSALDGTYKFNLCCAIPPFEGWRPVPTPPEGSIVTILGSCCFDLYFPHDKCLDSLTLL
jgi:hypothetical protein